MRGSRKIITIVTSILILSSIIYKPVYGIENGKKTVYLTFDDGLSPATTNEIMKVLQTNEVKANFFVIGRNARENSEIIKKISESGMSIMSHTNMYENNKIYSCREKYFKDLQNCENTLLSLTGKTKYNFVRIPGGPGNTIAKPEVLEEIKKDLIKSDKYYIDCSLDVGGADRSKVSVEFIESQVRELGGLYKVEVVSFHNLKNKMTTIESLQKTIDIYKERGYEFKTLDNINDDEIEYLKNIGVINKK